MTPQKRMWYEMYDSISGTIKKRQMNKRTPKFWSIREVSFLKDFHDFYTPTELAAITGHSVSSVYSKIKKLKLVLTERECRQCEERFMPTHQGHIYCCKRCKEIAYRARKLLKV